MAGDAGGLKSAQQGLVVFLLIRPSLHQPLFQFIGQLPGVIELSGEVHAVLFDRRMVLHRTHRFGDHGCIGSSGVRAKVGSESIHGVLRVDHQRDHALWFDGAWEVQINRFQFVTLKDGGRIDA